MALIPDPPSGANKPMSPRQRRRQFTRTDSEGNVSLAPLAHPYAIVVPWIGEKETNRQVALLDEQIAAIEVSQMESGSQRLGPGMRTLKEEREKLLRPIKIHELSHELLHIDPNDPSQTVGSANIPSRATQIRKELEALLKSYGKLDAAVPESGSRPVGVKFFSESSFLELKWRKGIGLDQDDIEVDGPHKFETGRSHFAIVRGGRRWEQALSGNTLAMSIRNQLRTYAHLNKREIELKGFVGTSQYLLELRLQGKKLRVLIAPHTRQPKDKTKLAELKAQADLVITTNHSWDQLPCLILRGQSALGVDANEYAAQVAKGNLGHGQAIGYFVATSQRKRDRPVFREDQGKSSLIELIDGLLIQQKAIVEGTLGVGKDVLPTDRNFVIVDRDQVGVIKELIKRDRYLIDRIDLLREFSDENDGLTVVLDAANRGESRFGLGGYLYPTIQKSQIGGIEWTPDIEGRKIVINPSEWFLNSALVNGHTGKTFDPDVWQNTTVVFYSTDINRARNEQRGFIEWIERYKNNTDPSFNPESIGLKIESPTQSKTVAKNKMKRDLFWQELEMARDLRTSLDVESRGWDYERNMGRFEGGGYVDIPPSSPGPQGLA